MKVLVDKTPGICNELLIELPIQEIEAAFMQVHDWRTLNDGEGMVRWRGSGEYSRTAAQLQNTKVSMAVHLQNLGILDKTRMPLCRAIAIGNRNLGNNHGVVAWHKDKQPSLFCLHGEPLAQRTYTCLVHHQDGRLTIQTLSFAGGQIKATNRTTDLRGDINWCTYGQQILKEGEVTGIEDLIHEFYDIRHVLAIDPTRETGRQILETVYAGQQAEVFNIDVFRQQARQQWLAGVPRSRYFHSCVGLSETNLFILQGEGTPETLAQRLAKVGAQDAVILDNGGSVGCWTWWVNGHRESQHPSGGFIFQAPDYRPPATSIIVFRMSGPVRTNVPAMHASVTVV